jgi:hypothetical protein
MALDAWCETALVSIAPSGYGELYFQALTETIDMDIGEKPVEFIPILNGGRVGKLAPQEDTTITMELYPLQSGTATWPASTTAKAATGVFDIMDGAQGQSGVFDHSRLQIRLTILWTDYASQSSATAATTTSANALRLSFADGYLTSIKPSFTDGILKFTVTGKFPAFNKANTACVYWESAGTTDTSLTALSSYTAGATTLFK